LRDGGIGRQREQNEPGDFPPWGKEPDAAWLPPKRGCVTTCRSGLKPVLRFPSRTQTEIHTILE